MDARTDVFEREWPDAAAGAVSRDRICLMQIAKCVGTVRRLHGKNTPIRNLHSRKSFESNIVANLHLLARL